MTQRPIESIADDLHRMSEQMAQGAKDAAEQMKATADRLIARAEELVADIKSFADIANEGFDQAEALRLRLGSKMPKEPTPSGDH